MREMSRDGGIEYRILATEYKFEDGTVDVCYQIHEVYYLKGKAISFTIEGTPVWGDSIKGIG
jgi:hypothetical protein